MGGVVVGGVVVPCWYVAQAALERLMFQLSGPFSTLTGLEAKVVTAVAAGSSECRCVSRSMQMMLAKSELSFRR